MILVDANLLIYASVSGFAQHNTARQWLERVLNQGPRVGLPWPSLLAFVRLSSNPRLFTRPQSIGEAWLQVEEWLNVAGVWIPIPGDHHREILRGLLRVAGVQSNIVPDAHSGGAGDRARSDPLFQQQRFQALSELALGKPDRRLSRMLPGNRTSRPAN